MKKLLFITGIFLIIGCYPEMEYGYYVFLRIIVSFVSGLYLFLNFESIETDFTYWNICFLLIFILFNPVFPVPLEQETWQALDVLSATIIMLKAYKLPNQNIIN